MEILVQQPLDEYIADQQKIAELEADFEDYIALLAKPVPNPFELAVGKEVVLIAGPSVAEDYRGRIGTVVEETAWHDFGWFVKLDGGPKLACSGKSLRVIG